MFVVTVGGSASGKSEFAESVAVSLGCRRLYIATMRPYGEEAARRIARHRALRAGKGFVSLDCYTGILNAVTDGYDVVLLECMSNLLANEMFGDPPVQQTRLADCLANQVCTLARRVPHLVVVSNDIGGDGERYDCHTEDYRESLGRINALLFQQADQVIEVVCGIPIYRKNGKEKS